MNHGSDGIAVAAGPRDDPLHRIAVGELDLGAELRIDGYPDIPNWKDWNARLGMAYDLFGDGSTALKLAAGRYVANEALGISDPFSPLSPTGNLDYRSWTDLNFDGTVINADGTPQYEEIDPAERRRRADRRVRVRRPRLRLLDGRATDDPGPGRLADVERVRGDRRRPAAARRLHERELHGRARTSSPSARPAAWTIPTGCGSATGTSRSGPWASCSAPCLRRSTR